MRINDDLTRAVIVHASKQAWVQSPAPGVERRMLFRIGEEKSRATSLVRYAPGSAFPQHVHTGGEEFVVLEGVFQDGAGDYPAGSYVRNPPGSAHAPAAKEGATIFVRLWQFRESDHTQLVRKPGEGAETPAREGAASATILFDDGHEQVRWEEWKPGGQVRIDVDQGLELLVISGDLHVDGESMSAHDWARFPAGHALRAEVGAEGASVWMKLGPLLHADVCFSTTD